MRPLATLLACLALAGLAVAAEGGAAKSPAAGSYIVVFKSNAVQGPTVATAARQIAVGTRRQRQLRLQPRARGLRGAHVAHRGRRGLA